MKGEVDRAKISKKVAAIDISQHSKTVMEKTSILANAFDSDVYLLSVVEMPNRPYVSRSRKLWLSQIT